MFHYFDCIGFIFRTGLVFSEYLLSGQVPSVKVVNDEEPFFESFPYLTVRKVIPLYNPPFGNAEIFFQLCFCTIHFFLIF
jgi:hypothetical protein